MHNYLARDPAHAEFLFESLLSEEGSPTDLPSAFGDDWANVAWCFQQMYDAPAVAATLDDLYTQNHNALVGRSEGGLTYYYTHGTQYLGDIQWDSHISIPASCTYYNESTDTYSYVVHNMRNVEQEAVVYGSWGEQVRFTVPANTLMIYQESGTVIGVMEVVDAGIEVWPNPCADVLNLGSVGKWEMIDAFGRQAASGNGRLINTSDLGRGMYFLEMGGKRVKVVVE